MKNKIGTAMHTIISGMRKVRNVEANIATSDVKKLQEALQLKLKISGKERTPTEWRVVFIL